MRAHTDIDIAGLVAMAGEAQARLRELLPQLQYEALLLDRIIHKNRNQHRRCGYFRRLAQFARQLHLLKSANLTKALQDSVPMLDSSSDQTISQFSLVSDIPVKEPRADDLARVWDRVLGLMWRFLGIARLLCRLQYPLMRASSLIAALLGQSFFMPFGLTVFAILARLRILLLQAFHDVITLYNLLSHGCDCKMRVSKEVADDHLVRRDSKKRMIFVQGSMIEDSLPLWLVCQTKEERLYLQEIRSEELPEFVNSETFPSSQWFQDVVRKGGSINAKWIQKITMSIKHPKSESKGVSSPALVEAKSAKNASPILTLSRATTDSVNQKRQSILSFAGPKTVEEAEAKDDLQVSGIENVSNRSTSPGKKKVKTEASSLEDMIRRKKELLEYLEQPILSGTPVSLQGSGIGSPLEVSSQGSKRKVAYFSVASGSPHQPKSTEAGGGIARTSGDLHSSQLASTPLDVDKTTNTDGCQVKQRTDNLFEMLLGEGKFDSLF